MSGLYTSGYRPSRLARRFEACSVLIKGQGQAAEIMRRKGVPSAWGDPHDVVGFFDENGDGSLGAMTADYPNGRRAEWKQRARDNTLRLTLTPQVPA